MYSIGQIAKKSGISVETIRFYEKKGYWKNHKGRKVVIVNTMKVS